MTTIAFDGVTMAADRQCGGAHIMRVLEPKLFRVNGSVFGVCGRLEHIVMMRDWLRKGGEKPNLGDHFEALEARNGACWYYSSGLARCRLDFPASIGSGQDFAMAAMYAGKDARNAVKIAIKLDEGSGLGIQTFKAPA
ncbi:MAG: hypothetical protein V3R83_10960 [Gammaproteobacteria bacterium]